jgi:hypothetical protein
MGHAYQNVETGVEPVRRPVLGPLSIFNILKMEKKKKGRLYGRPDTTESAFLPCGKYCI